MALREINLIPGEVVHHTHVVRHLCFWTACVVVSLSLVLGIYFYHHMWVVLTKKTNPSRLEDTYTHLNKKVEESHRIQQELDSLTQQQSALKIIKTHQPYFEVLLRLSHIMNQHTWLTQLAMNKRKDTTDNINMQLIGFSVSNQDLANLIQYLSAEPIFQTIELKYAREVKIGQALESMVTQPLLIKFQIDCHMKERV